MSAQRRAAAGTADGLLEGRRSDRRPRAPRRVVEWPPAVYPGARVGVAALSGPVVPERLEAGLDTLRGLGFEPVLAANVRSRHGLFAGADAARAEGFHRLVADPSIAAIAFVRGGHGVLRVLPLLDWRLLRRRPLAFVGYSDLTPFLLQVVTRLGRVAFHGPMVGAELAAAPSDAEVASLLAALAGEPPTPTSLPLAVRGGSATGPFLGGCLSLLAATAGTRWAPRLAGGLLLLEDVGEPLYRLDRMLCQLRLARLLDGVRGVVVAGAADPGPAATGSGAPAPAPAPPAVPGWWGVLAEALPDAGVPLAGGLAAGHERPNLTWPLGAAARLEVSADGARLDFAGAEP